VEYAVTVDDSMGHSQFSEARPSAHGCDCFDTGDQDAQNLERTCQLLQKFEANVAIEVSADSQALRIHHPEWVQAYEDAMPHTACTDELMALLISAPTAYAKGLISGLCSMRIEMAAISGRFF